MMILGRCICHEERPLSRQYNQRELLVAKEASLKMKDTTDCLVNNPFFRFPHYDIVGKPDQPNDIYDDK